MRAGLTRRQLEGRTWRRIGPGLYCWVRWAQDDLAILKAAARRLPPGAVFSGRTAAWLHGLDLPACDPIEITIPNEAASSGWRGFTIRRRRLEAMDVSVARGLPATSPLRTPVDMACDLPLFDAVTAIDMALHRGLIELVELHGYSADHPDAYRVARLRRVAGLAEPKSESPMETRLRLLFVLGGLPRPLAQVSLYDDSEAFLGRADLYYPDPRLVIEYDGGTHRLSLVEDNRRQNLILGAGFRMLRFTAADIHSRPDTVVLQVRTALAA